jgi:quinol monooxygenase YgiN
MAEVRLVVKIEVEPDRLDEYLSLVKELVLESRQEEGCIRYDL